MGNATEISIRWNFIGNTYKHVRMYRGDFFAFTHEPYIDGDSWILSEGKSVSITDLVSGDFSKIDWKTFSVERGQKPTKLEDVKVENSIEWNYIGNKFKHVRMFKNKSFFVFEHTPYISDDVWVSLVGTCRNITGLVSGDFSKIDWESFSIERVQKPTKLEEVEMENKTEIYYTEDMQNGDVDVVKGVLYIDSDNRKCRLVGVINEYLVGVVIGGISGCADLELSYCLESQCKPIDTRTNKEKLIDDMVDVLYNDDNLYVDKDDSFDIATILVMSSKFKITKN